ncbi:hypothetical protein [Mesorhizobium sp. INR15]|uniref:hypothetical protein n=1 Tax=Mesorhizobium sp. INR15 TaxID=2654248 RepID=UPI00215649DA|nr:hypothetical protein [Mesorhizobium sp. INR15]
MISHAAIGVMTAEALMRRLEFVTVVLTLDSCWTTQPRAKSRTTPVRQGHEGIRVVEHELLADTHVGT